VLAVRGVPVKEDVRGPLRPLDDAEREAVDRIVAEYAP
jgi:dihydrodipicolinate synthase/N-acetylneuraminate lyase